MNYRIFLCNSVSMYPVGIMIETDFVYRRIFMVIDLDDIVDAIQGGSNSVEYYLNTRSGEIIMRDDSLPTRELM